MANRTTQTSSNADVQHAVIQHIDAACRSLDERPPSDASVHDARKQMKRIRGGLRLLRSALGEATYDRLNRTVRDAARPLTPVRDAKVLCDSLDVLSRRVGRSVAGSVTPVLQETLQHELHARRDKLADEDLDAIQTTLQQIEKQLRESAVALPWTLDGAATAAALKRAHKRARQAFKAVRREADDENLHEWRKQVKYQIHQLEIIKPAKPKRMRAIISRMQRLAEYLGDDHDLALLHEQVAYAAHSSISEKDLQRLIKALQRRRAKLQHKAYRLGNKLYIDKPADYRFRVNANDLTVRHH